MRNAEANRRPGSGEFIPHSALRVLAVRVDFVFRPSRLALFVDGCFWHGCPKYATQPKNNRVFWRRRFARNRERDELVNRTLRKSGWRVLQIWECDLARRPKLVFAGFSERCAADRGQKNSRARRPGTQPGRLRHGVRFTPQRGSADRPASGFARSVPRRARRPSGRPSAFAARGFSARCCPSSTAGRPSPCSSGRCGGCGRWPGFPRRDSTTGRRARRRRRR
ncbi:MAG: hypothetical protein EXS33_01965 [Pedosphaera sp.]|nr:hypothetical protein [Pedosphaera sp.]